MTMFSFFELEEAITFKIVGHVLFSYMHMKCLHLKNGLT